MRLDEGEGIVDVQTCSERDDVLLTTAQGQAIRFEVGDVRVFKGRDSMGVRGINLGNGDNVISLAILRHVDADAAERAAYLKMQALLGGEGVEEEAEEAAEEADATASISQERYTELSASEQFILTVSRKGYGKRTSSYRYRVTGRGGKGITTMAVTGRNGQLVASFPVEHTDQLMLVTDGGQLIRVPVDGIRIAGRKTQGVIVFNTSDGERVVSVERIGEEDGAASEEASNESDI
jgi:DNA gyrase subunit A